MTEALIAGQTVPASTGDKEVAKIAIKGDQFVGSGSLDLTNKANFSVVDLKTNNLNELDFKSRKERVLSEYPGFESKITRIGQVFASSFISPESTGDIVFKAIKNNAFYILTHKDPFWKSMIKERMDGIFHAFNRS